jgi:diguanylate cyclase (GGDEF)-like protein
MTITRIGDAPVTATDSAAWPPGPTGAIAPRHGDRCEHGRRVDAPADADDAGVPRCGTCGQPLGCWTTDRLTGLLDRWGWDDTAPAAFRRARRHRQDVVLMLVDLDRFKAINDDLGHPAGDSVLQEVAGVLLRNTRRGDVVSRYGGDEFLVLLPNASATEAIGVADRILRGIQALAIEVTANSGTTIRLDGLSASVGVAPYAAERVETLAELVRHTDAALQCAKTSGRGRMYVHDPSEPRVDAGFDRAGTWTASSSRYRTTVDRSEELRRLMDLRQLMNGDWIPDVLHVLADGPKHHGDLLAAIRSSEVIDEWSGRDRNIQTSILNRTLRRLVDNGFVHRHEEPGVWPRSVRYALTPAAQEWLSDVLPAVSAWCDRHSELISRAQRLRIGNRQLKVVEGQTRPSQE